MVSRPLKKVQVPEVLMAEARDSMVRVVLAVDLAASARAAAATMNTISKTATWAIWEIFWRYLWKYVPWSERQSERQLRRSGLPQPERIWRLRRKKYAGKGSDLHSEVSVSFEEAAFGCDRVMRLSDPSGNGVIQTLKVHVPAGIEDGKSIRLKGKGNPGFNGGPAGDLFLKVNVASKPGFERKGMDIYTTANIPFTTAVFGGEAKVTTLYGDVICKIPEGTQSGRKIRLKGKGIVSMKDSAVHGNQYVTVQIQVPQNLSPEAKEKLREFQQVLRKDTQKRRGSAA